MSITSSMGFVIDGEMTRAHKIEDSFSMLYIMETKSPYSAKLTYDNISFELQ